jgi:SpoVK/Ycf46/Vps4 family AAA+-type ATPase
MSQQTRGEIITEKLKILETNLKPYMMNSMFSLQDYDLADIVFLLSVTFKDINTEDEYKQKLKELILLQEPKFDQFEKVNPIIIEFIIFFKGLD